MRSMTLLAAAALLAAPAAAKWNVDVQQTAALNAMHAVAIAPLSCPPDIDCAKAEKDLVKLIREKTPMAVIEPAQIKQAAFNEGLTAPIPDEALRRIAAALGADAVLVADIGAVSTKHTGAAIVPVGTSFVAVDEQKKNSSCSLLITNLEGKPLMQGTGFGESRNAFRSESGMVEKMFRLILEKAFPGR